MISLEMTLVNRARDGDTDSWARVYRSHFDGVFRHIRYLCGDPAVAEELVQETFVQAMLNLPKFRGQSKFSTWLHGIALNVVRGHWRKSRNKSRAHERLSDIIATRAPHDESSPDRNVGRRQRVAALYEALDEIPEHLRVAVIMRDIEELTPDEAAAQLGISVSNFKVRATRARQRLRKILSRMGFEGMNDQ